MRAHFSLRPGMGDGTEIPRGLRPATAVAGLGPGLIFLNLREVMGLGLKIPQVRDTKISRDSGQSRTFLLSRGIP